MLVKSLKPRLIDSIPLLKPQTGSSGTRKVWIEAYGCSASIADYEMIGGMMKEAGFGMATSPDDASLSVIVTCSVKDTTEHRMLDRIRSLTKSGMPLVVAGCLPKADRAKVEALNPSAGLLGPGSIDKVVDVATSALSGVKRVALEDTGRDKVNVPRVRINPVVSIVEIASGCLSECTFCQTKLAKGKLQSYRVGDIVRQIESDVRSGCREVWLTSTDNGCYGLDIGTDLVELLSACASVPGDFMIRLGMMNPMYLPRMLDRLANIFREEEKLFKFIHIPVESGSNDVLREMKRGHSAETYLKAVRLFRQRLPEMTIATDVIVGFPGETSDDFKKTLSIIQDSEPDIVNISRYGARPGTEAARRKSDRVSSKVAKSRSMELTRLAREISRKRNSTWNGWEGDVVIDEIVNRTISQGRNYAYKPVVINSRLSPGGRAKVHVYGFSSFSLRAKIIL